MDGVVSVRLGIYKAALAVGIKRFCRRDLINITMRMCGSLHRSFLIHQLDAQLMIRQGRA